MTISMDKQYEWLNAAKQVLDYDPDTGIFTWKISAGKKKAGDIAGTIAVNSYRYIRVNKQSMLAHRIAFAWVYGEFPQNQIDHINGIKIDNRIANLRQATNQQNAANSSKRKDNSSGFKGVRKARTTGKWYATICVNGKERYLGTYNSPELAHQAYMKAAVVEFGEFAKSI